MFQSILDLYDEYQRYIGNIYFRRKFEWRNIHRIVRTMDFADLDRPTRTVALD